MQQRPIRLTLGLEAFFVVSKAFYNAGVFCRTSGRQQSANETTAVPGKHWRGDEWCVVCSACSEREHCRVKSYIHVCLHTRS